MGSTGTGRLSDYTGSQGQPGGPGGSSGEDPCNEPIETWLEDVERCEYYKNHQTLPEAGTDITVSLVKRLNITTNDGETIGYLPTKYNYLATCAKNSIQYTGKVISSTKKPLHKVLINLSRA